MISQGKDVNSLLRYRRSSVHFYSATTTFYTEIHIFFETVLSLQVSKSSYLRLRQESGNHLENTVRFSFTIKAKTQQQGMCITATEKYLQIFQFQRREMHQYLLLQSVDTVYKCLIDMIIDRKPIAKLYHRFKRCVVIVLC